MVVGINDLIVNGIKAKKDVLNVNFFTYKELSNYVEVILSIPDLELILDFDDVDVYPEIFETETGYEIKDIDSFYESYVVNNDSKKKSSILLNTDLLNSSIFADAGLMVYDNNGKLQAVSEDKTDTTIRGLTADRVHQLVNDYLSDMYSLYRERKDSTRVCVDPTSFNSLPANAYFLIRRDRLVSDAYSLFRVMDSYESDDELIPVIKSIIQSNIIKELNERFDSYEYLLENKNTIPFRTSDLLEDNITILDSFIKRDKIVSDLINSDRSKHEKKI